MARRKNVTALATRAMTDAAYEWIGNQTPGQALLRALAAETIKSVLPSVGSMFQSQAEIHRNAALASQRAPVIADLEVQERQLRIALLAKQLSGTARRGKKQAAAAAAGA